jgi:hypothetical protein
LKNIYFKENYNFDIDILKNEFHLIYKLIKLQRECRFCLGFGNSKNLYLSSLNTKLKLNYLKCFFNQIDHLFFNFHHFDIYINFKHK